MRIDLHTHSSVSDGTDSPASLVRSAAAAGLEVVALTDHDTLAGLPEATAEAHRAGLRLVPGLEMSSRLGGASVHVLGYFVDPPSAALAGELAAIRQARSRRVPEIVTRLRRAGLRVSVEDVRRAAGAAASIGRPHVADALVGLGLVADRDEAFDRWLAAGRPGAVAKREPATADAVRLIRESGGVPVLAHPWGSGSRAALTPAALAALRDAGVVGIEVDHGDHDADARGRLRELADDLGLVATGSSDYHGTGKTGHELGSNRTDPGEFARLLDAAGGLAAAAGRSAPVIDRR